MILYIKYPKNSTPKLLELISEYSKVAGHKINTQKSVSFLYTNNEPIQREIRKTIPFTIISKRIKYLGVNLTKEGKDLYPEIYKTLLTEVKKDTKNGNSSHALGQEEIISSNWPSCPKKYTDFMQSLSNYQQHSSTNWKK